MKARLTLFCALLLVCTGVASAQGFDMFSGGIEMSTPDGLPPSVEDVCDGQKGAAFGLCNAYCEAMDCDSANPQASQKACDRVAANYEKHAGSPPPCSCPCNNVIPGYLEALNGDFGLAGCGGFNNPDFDVFFGLQTLNPPLVVGAQAQYVTNQGACGIVGGNFILISINEAESCLAQVEQAANSAGLSCPQP
ncbi:MAG TPA: hypothetical protein VKU40_10500 [Thermoanaerobaculia bacterium]|nr:hypothetical protein [Thermoanaerobaculia bacterium]